MHTLKKKEQQAIMQCKTNVNYKRKVLIALIKIKIELFFFFLMNHCFFQRYELLTTLNIRLTTHLSYFRRNKKIVIYPSLKSGGECTIKRDKMYDTFIIENIITKNKLCISFRFCLWDCTFTIQKIIFEKDMNINLTTFNQFTQVIKKLTTEL